MAEAVEEVAAVEEMVKVAEAPEEVGERAAVT